MCTAKLMTADHQGTYEIIPFHGHFFNWRRTTDKSTAEIFALHRPAARQYRTGMKPDDVELIAKDALCQRLRISPWTLDRMIRSGRFPQPIWLGPTTARWRVAEALVWETDPARRERPKPRLPPRP
jgi:predicted DNA-binding transcriptional regulator AlpA